MTDDILATVVIAVHADERARRAVAALQRQSIGPARLQIIVVENGSALLTDLAGHPGVEYLHLESPNSAQARNAGLDRARGMYVLTTDADCIPDTTWVERLTLAMSSHVAAVAGGSIRKHLPRTWVQRNAITVVDGQTAPNYLPASPLPYVAGANAAFDADLLRSVGGFDAELRSGNDVDVCWKMQRAGGILITVPDAVVAHEDRSTLIAHLGRFRFYARFQVLLFAKHKQHSTRRLVLDGYPFRRAGRAGADLPRALVALIRRGDLNPAQQVLLQLAESAGVLAGTVEGAIIYRQPYL